MKKNNQKRISAKEETKTHYLMGKDLNSIIRAIWEKDKNVRADTIIRVYYRLKKEFGSNRVRIPITFSLYKTNVIKDFVKYNVSMTIKNFNKYGLTRGDYVEFMKINPDISK